MSPGPDSRDLPLRHTQDTGEPGVGAGTMGELQGPEHVAELPVERAASLIGPGRAELEHSLSLSIAGVRVRGVRGRRRAGSLVFSLCKRVL